MKKALSLFLAILMMFSVLSVGSFAEGAETPQQLKDLLVGADKMTDSDCTLVFWIDGGTYLGTQRVFDTEKGDFVNKTPEEMKSIEPYVKLPLEKGQQEPGARVALPDVDGKTGYAFVGWYCVRDGQTYAAGYSAYSIPQKFYATVEDKKNDNGESAAGQVIDFQAVYRPAKVEEDTFAKVFDILAKIFGTIIGLIAYEGDTAAGIAFVRKIFSGITD